MTHHELSPSAYPAWAICPKYESKGASADTTAGTEAHELLYDAFTGAVDIDSEPNPDFMWHCVSNAYHGINSLINEILAGEPADIRFYEETLHAHPSFIGEALFGTADVIAVKGDHIIVVDYKHRFSDRTYTEQLAAYAAFYQSNYPNVNTASLVVWYGDTSTYEIESYSIDECREMTLNAINRRKSVGSLPCTSSAWCSLCKHCGVCKAALSLVDKSTEIVPANPSIELIPPTKMPALLVVCSELEKRIKAVREFCKQYAIEHGGITEEDGTLAYAISESTKRKVDIISVFEEIKSFIPPSELIGAASITQKALKALLAPHLKKCEINDLISRCSTEGDKTIELRRVKR